MLSQRRTFLLALIYNRIGMGLEVWVYPGLTKAEGVEVGRGGYPRDWSRYWRADIVNGT
ncbi:MAG: hypothetical protein QM757_24015 [Paludibaculum sp.]